MKKFLIVLSFIYLGYALILSACSNSAGTKTKTPDTARVVALFSVGDQFLLRTDYLLRVRKDTVVEDNGKFKAIPKEKYLLVLALPDSINGKPRFDTLGKPLYRTFDIPIDTADIIQVWDKLPPGVKKIPF